MNRHKNSDTSYKFISPGNELEMKFSCFINKMIMSFTCYTNKSNLVEDMSNVLLTEWIYTRLILKIKLRNNLLI